MLKFATCWIAFRPKWATWLYLNVHAEVLPKCFPMVQLHVQLQDHYAATDLQIFNLTSKTHFFTCNATFKCSSSLPHLVFQRWNQDESCAKTLEVLPGCQQALGSGTGSSTQEPPFAIFLTHAVKGKAAAKLCSLIERMTSCNCHTNVLFDFTCSLNLLRPYLRSDLL